MRKSILLFLLFSIIICKCFSQTEIGFKAGYTYSTARVALKNTRPETGFVSGFMAGIMFKAPFDGPLNFSPSITFSRRGYSYTMDSGKLIKTENTIYYLDLTPSLSLDFTDKNKKGFVIGFGPQFGVAISGKEKRSYRNDSTFSENMAFSFVSYGRYDIGAHGSLAYRFNKKLMLEASGFLSFINLENNDYNPRNIRNRMLAISLGYYFK